MKGAEVWTPEPQTHLQHPAPPGRRGGSAAPEPSTDCADAILGGPTGASVAAAAAAAAPSPPLPPGASPTAPLAPVDATRAGMTVSSCAAEPSDPGLDPAMRLRVPAAGAGRCSSWAAAAGAVPRSFGATRAAGAQAACLLPCPE